MNALLHLFPQNNFTLIAVILLMPLIGAIVNGIWGKRLGKSAVRLMALSSIGASFVAALISFLALDAVVGHGGAGHGGAGHEAPHAKLSWLAWEWMRTTGARDVSVPIEIKFSIDALSGVMMLVITGVGFLIHLYATSYMDKDKAFWRFFAYLNLFVFSMLVLVLGDNLPVLFVGWEGVGLCSYLLIGFWYEHKPNAAAGKKAFIANRVGDFGLLCAMFLLVYYTGALDWTGIETGASSLVTTADNTRVHLWPIGGGHFQGFLSFLEPASGPMRFIGVKKAVTISAATAVGLMLLLGCTGKSAQLPLYIWLPDAMAGPTPVSALIHAATMVTAGVYLVCRLSFVFVLSPFVMNTVAVIGALTALLAASIALVQNDIKKVLAYSTVSQLGFMFLGVGVGAFTAGFFHVFTHAFFKACLFLGAGSVIHAMHSRIHDDDRAQDMRNMGGLKKYMPYTYWTFLVSTLAIIGFPLTSGFFSKDEILFRAFVNSPTHPLADQILKARHVKLYASPTWLGPALYAVGVLAATMTAFYMMRLFINTFLGEFRGWTVGRPSKLPDAHHDDHDEAHHHDDLSEPGHPPHESPWQMTMPLIILAVAAAFAGLILNPAFLHSFIPSIPVAMEHWLEPVFNEATRGAVKENPNAHHLEGFLALGGFLAFAGGSGTAWWMYVVKQGEPARELVLRSGRLYRWALDKWYVDEFYEKTILNWMDALSETAAALDRSVIDAILARLTAIIVSAAGSVLRFAQNGVVHVYSGAMVLGVVVLGWFFVAPHADATVKAQENGDYVVQAAPGIGYGYRFYDDAGGKPRADVFAGTTDYKVHLEAGKKQTVRVEVLNAFGLRSSRTFTIAREEQMKVIKVGQN